MAENANDDAVVIERLLCTFESSYQNLSMRFVNQLVEYAFKI